MTKKPDAIWVQEALRAAVHECPACHRRMDATTAVSSDNPHGQPLRPGPGDRMICAYCSALMVYQSNGTPRLATTDEIADLPEWIRHLVAGQPLANPRKIRPQ